MHVLPCKICQVEINHQAVNVADTLPPNIAVLECTGCGLLSVRSIITKSYNRSINE